MIIKLGCFINIHILLSFLNSQQLLSSHLLLQSCLIWRLLRNLIFYLTYWHLKNREKRNHSRFPEFVKHFYFFGITRIGFIIKLARLWSKHLWYFITQRLKPRRLSGRVPISCVLYGELFFQPRAVEEAVGCFLSNFWRNIFFWNFDRHLWGATKNTLKYFFWGLFGPVKVA